MQRLQGTALEEGSRSATVRSARNADYHYKITARERLDLLLDEGWVEHDCTLHSTDPLNFKANKTYKESLASLPAKIGVQEAVSLRQRHPRWHSASWSPPWSTTSSAAPWDPSSEKRSRGPSNGPLQQNSAIVIVSCSGGARMQEGALSLMQMAKISAALALLDNKKLPYISVLTDPTTGGVTASFAMLGDLNISEPGALIGFAGPRVIEQTIRQKLPEGFQRAEFLARSRHGRRHRGAQGPESLHLHRAEPPA